LLFNYLSDVTQKRTMSTKGTKITKMLGEGIGVSLQQCLEVCTKQPI